MISETGVRVVAEYWDTRLANAVASVFNGNLNNLNILITGDSGVGTPTTASKSATLSTSLGIGALSTVVTIASISLLMRMLRMKPHVGVGR